MAYKGYIDNNAASLLFKYWLAARTLSTDSAGIAITLKDENGVAISKNTFTTVVPDSSFGWGYRQQEFTVALYPHAVKATIQLSCVPTSGVCKSLIDSVCLDISAPSSYVTFVTPTTCSLQCNPGNVLGNCTELQKAIESSYAPSGVVSVDDGSYTVSKIITIAGKQVVLETSALSTYASDIDSTGGLAACLADALCATGLISANPVRIICDQLASACSGVSQDNSVYCFVLNAGGDVSFLSSAATFQTVPISSILDYNLCFLLRIQL